MKQIRPYKKSRMTFPPYPDFHNPVGTHVSGQSSLYVQSLLLSSSRIFMSCYSPPFTWMKHQCTQSSYFHLIKQQQQQQNRGWEDPGPSQKPRSDFIITQEVFIYSPFIKLNSQGAVQSNTQELGLWRKRLDSHPSSATCQVRLGTLLNFLRSKFLHL